jgi:hypothetical protein
MNTSVCTLFEGNYHLGLGALVNSLCQNGFEGRVYAGYRGKLPQWAQVTRIDGQKGFPVTFEMEVTEKVMLVFVPLKTDYHFTNYKPDFILELFAQDDFESEALFYLDPDIVVNAHWDTFKQWVSFGVALSEDVNSPISVHHPIRAGWRTYFANFGIELTQKDAVYVNGGFVGVKRGDLEFIVTWKAIQEVMSSAIGGLNRSALAGAPLNKSDTGVFAPFSKTDQDALNATIEASAIPLSIAGKEAMGFASGVSILPHALGHPKPWAKKPIYESISGYPPRLVDKLYWKNVDAPVRVFAPHKIWLKSVAYKLAILISRFYRRN